jgi:hypothetical protein
MLSLLASLLAVPTDIFLVNPAFSLIRDEKFKRDKSRIPGYHIFVIKLLFHKDVHAPGKGAGRLRR